MHDENFADLEHDDYVAPACAHCFETLPEGEGVADGRWMLCRPCAFEVREQEREEVTHVES